MDEAPSDDITDHDTYIAAAPEPFRELLTALRQQIAELLPEAEEVIRYRMPGFRLGGEIVAGYAAFSRQCGLYLAPGALSAHAEEVAAAGLTATKTGVTVTPRRPIPADLVERLVQASREELGV